MVATGPVPFGLTRTGAWILVALLAIVACGAERVDASSVPPLPETSPQDLADRIATSGTPVVVNVWASWCIPCRSEAPLLAAAAEQFAGEVGFIGLNVRDSQQGARSFIAEFFPDAPIVHVFDAGGDVPLALGASRAVPITIFVSASGVPHRIRTGVLDERTLALEIDELLVGG